MDLYLKKIIIKSSSGEAVSGIKSKTSQVKSSVLTMHEHLIFKNIASYVTKLFDRPETIANFVYIEAAVSSKVMRSMSSSERLQQLSLTF